MVAKRVFVLGAGFSKQAGMPLATELTSLILDGTILKEQEEMQSWAAGFRQRLAAVEGAGDDAGSFLPNIEQLFDFAAYDEEWWRMRQQLCPVGRIQGPDTPWNAANSIRTWLRYMERELAHVIWDTQQEADQEPVRRFAGCLGPDDVVMTFNYDTLLETALASEGRPWNHGLDDSGNGGVTVLKMHGSVDWLMLKRRPGREPQGFVKIFSKRDVNVEEHGSPPPRDEPEYDWELWRAKDRNACSGIIRVDKSGLSNSRYRLGLAGLGRYKPLHELSGSAPTWLAAFDALKNADKLHVVGFSMSPYDSMTRFHFTAVMHSRSRPPDQVVVIDPNAEKLRGLLSVVFGRRPEVIASVAQDVDWQRILG